MNIQIIIETENAAFEDNFEAEIHRAMAKATADILLSTAPSEYVLLDSNGNACGHVSVED